MGFLDWFFDSIAKGYVKAKVGAMKKEDPEFAKEIERMKKAQKELDESLDVFMNTSKPSLLYTSRKIPLKLTYTTLEIETGKKIDFCLEKKNIAKQSNVEFRIGFFKDNNIIQEENIIYKEATKLKGNKIELIFLKEFDLIKAEFLQSTQSHRGQVKVLKGDGKFYDVKK